MDELFTCELCKEDYPREELHFECQLGPLCNRCKRGLISRGEILTFDVVPTEPTEDPDKEVNNNWVNYPEGV